MSPGSPLDLTIVDGRVAHVIKPHSVGEAVRTIHGGGPARATERLEGIATEAAKPGFDPRVIRQARVPSTPGGWLLVAVDPRLRRISFDTQPVTVAELEAGISRFASTVHNFENTWIAIRLTGQ